MSTYKELYKDWLRNSQLVFSAFSTTFGEENIEMSPILSYRQFLAHIGVYGIDEEHFKKLTKREIVVHFPKITICNEQEQKHTIYDLFVQTSFNGRGEFVTGPLFKRASYTKAELQADYMHSHVPGIGSPNEWRVCCLGSGPINTTITTLRLDPTWENWLLYTVHLNQYVQVESLSGGPYRRMESTSLNGRDRVSSYDFALLSMREILNMGIPIKDFKLFISYLLENLSTYNIRMSYIKHPSWNMNVLETTITLSKAFRDWYNAGHTELTVQDLRDRKILISCIVEGDTIVSEAFKNDHNFDKVGSEVIIFKGRLYTVNIIPVEIEGPNTRLLLSQSFITQIIHYLLLVLIYVNSDCYSKGLLVSI